MKELFDAQGQMAANEQRYIADLRKEHGLKEKDERRLPLGFLGMSIKSYFFKAREPGDTSRNLLGGDADIEVEEDDGNYAQPPAAGGQGL